MGLFTTLTTPETGEIQWHQGDDDDCGYVKVGEKVGCPDGLYRGDGDGGWHYLVPVAKGIVMPPIPLIPHTEWGPTDESMCGLQINALVELTGLGYI